jgi:hypothetical protein
MVALDRIRLTGLLRKGPASAGLFYEVRYLPNEAWNCRRTGMLPSTLGKDADMIILGLILLLLGFALGIGILYSLGVVLLVVGVILYLLGSTNRAVGGRRHFY